MAVATRLHLLAHMYGARISAVCAVSITLAACNEQNAYVPPPPPKVDVALPLKQDVTPYLAATGNTVAVNTTTLVARVTGFIQEIDYKDGDAVKEGTKLFVIEPEPYQLALEQAQASVSSADAAAKQSQANYDRTAALVKKGFATQQDLDGASAQQAADAARQKQAAVDVKQAQLNLDYTDVKAPFDGIVTARQVSMGQLVSPGTSTLATVVQLNPIHVTFNISEQDVQRIRANMMARGVITIEDLKKFRSRSACRRRTAIRTRACSTTHRPISILHPARFRRALFLTTRSARCCPGISFASACRSPISRICSWCRKSDWRRPERALRAGRRQG